MTALQSRLDDRHRELKVFLRFVEKIERDSTLSVRYARGRRAQPIDEAVVKILKANCVLLLYNFIEASIRDAFQWLYDEVRTDGCTIRGVTEQLRHLWVDAAVERARRPSASLDTYRDVTRSLVGEVFRDVEAVLRVEDLSFGGNLDADVIRRTCQRHGVRVQVDRRARGGQGLQLVKSQRNALAHGSLSFSECGRDFTAADLVSLAHEVVLFVRGVLRSVERHGRRRAFRLG